MKSLERSFGRLGSGLKSAGATLTAAVTLPIIAVGGAAIKAAIDFETAFSGVSKTVDGVADSKGKLTAFGEELKQQFRDLAKTIPVSVNELAKIGETAGAMGIPKEKILDFTAVMAKLGATTNLTSDQAAASIGKIQNVYQAAGVETDRFASALVALGNAGASTEADIVAFAERMGGAAVQLKVSQAEVLGWSNAMASVGLNAELGSTAWNKTISSIGMAVDLGGEKLLGFAKVAGMTAAEFSKLFKDDASEALTRVVEGFGRVSASGGNLTQTMMDLGMKTSGIQMTFKNLASSGDLVRDSLDLGKKAWQDNNAMQEEFNKKAATTQSMLKVLYNRLYDIGISLGEQLLPAFKRLLPAIESTLQGLVGLVQWFSKLPQPVQTVAIGMTALFAAMGPVIFAVGQVAGAFSALITAGRTVSAAFGASGAITAGVTAVKGAFAALGTVLAGISWPVVAIVAIGTALTAAGVAVLKFTGLWDPLVSIVRDVATIWKNLFIAEIERGKQAIKACADVVAGAFVDAWNLAKGALASFLGVSQNQLVPALKLLGASVMESVPGLREMIDAVKWLKANVPSWATGMRSAAEASERMADSARRGAPAAPTQNIFAPQKPTGLNTSGFDMSGAFGGGTTRGIAGLKAFGDAAETAGEQGSKAGKKAAADWKKWIDQISGRDAIGDLQKWIKGVDQLGGINRLSVKDHDRLNDALTDAFDAYKRLGLSVPLNELKRFTELQKAAFDTTLPLSDATRQQAGHLAALKAWTERQTPQMVAPTIIPTMSAESLASLKTNMIGPVEQAFRDLGYSLPDLIFGALQNGGSIVGTIASGLASQFAATFAKGIQLIDGKEIFKGTSGQAALGMIGMGISAAIGGYALGTQFGKVGGTLAGAGSGALAGAAFGSVVPGIGTAVGAGVGALVGGIAGFFGGRSKDKKQKQAMEEERKKLLDHFGGMAKLKVIAADVGVEIDKAFTTKKPAEFQAIVEQLNAALEKQQAKFEGIATVLDGVNARAAVFAKTIAATTEKMNTEIADKLKAAGLDKDSAQGKALTEQTRETYRASNQGEFDRIGTMAVAAFALQMQTAGSAIEALAALAPTLATIRDAQAQFNFTVSDSVQRLLELNAAVEANRPAFEALAADGQILRGMLQGNLMDLELFKAVSTDITAQVQSIIDQGVPMSQALALSQPQLQALWEAQQKFGFETDEATQALLDQAQQQGIVGANMKSVNDKILDVLLAIAKVLKADIPAGLAGLPGQADKAAKGVQDAFNGIKIPPVQVGVEFAGDLGQWEEFFRNERPSITEAPAMRLGGIVPATPGGRLVRVAEGGRDEAIVPLPSSGVKAGGMMTVVIERDGYREAEWLVPFLPGEVQRLGLA
jgi:TP901 family phage tail tape measure protein